MAGTTIAARAPTRPRLFGRTRLAPQGSAGVARTPATLELASAAGVLPRRWFPSVPDAFAALVRRLAHLVAWTAISRTARGWGTRFAVTAARPG